MFEALVYTQDRAVEIRCAKAFADLPLDWVMLRDADAASEFATRQRFDFVIVDVDAPEGSSVLATLLGCGDELRSAVVAVSARPVDPALLRICYQSQVYYPVRPQDLEDAIVLAAPLAEAFSACGPSPAPVLPQPFDMTECLDDRCFYFRRDSVSVQVPALLSKARSAPGMFGSYIASLFGMKHSLSIRAQEWVASLIASAGTMWYVHEITTKFAGIGCIRPPSPGPTDLIALSLLLWLCAKSRRVSEKTAAAVVVMA